MITNTILDKIEVGVYDKCFFEMYNLILEEEGQDYFACSFKLNQRKVVCRNSKITPKKIGQFVTFWKRDENGITTPFKETDDFDLYVINAKSENKFGQFVFPKSELIKRGIVSTEKKEGKRGFRVYPSWDTVENKQAEKTQKWQLDYFYEVKDNIDFERVIKLYSNT